jgi:ketosteroid isomerase-like protein
MHPNQRLVQEGFQALCAGDIDVVERLLHPDVSVHVPEPSDLAGHYFGREQVVSWVRRGVDLVGGEWHFRPVAVLADDVRAVLLWVAQSEEGDTVTIQRWVALLSLRSNRVTDIWITQMDVGKQEGRATADSAA